jgi:hypothetical protein
LTFLIEPTRLAEGTCGRIELRTGSPEVFVQVSPDLLAFPEAVLATISHEVSHKFLHMNGVSWGCGVSNHHHNEVLTDITGIFLGLGKLLLNGQLVERIVREGSSQTRHTRKVGYLERDQLAFVYLLTCHMRKIADEDLMNDLSSASIASVQNTRRRFATYFQRKLHNQEHVEGIRSETRSLIENARAKTGLFLQAVARSRKRLDSLEADTLAKDSANADAVEATLSGLRDNDVDPCLRYLNHLALDHLHRIAATDLERATTAIESATMLADEVLRQLRTDGEERGGVVRRLATIFSGRGSRNQR